MYQTPIQKSPKKTSKGNLCVVAMGKQGKVPGDKSEVLMEDTPSGGEWHGCSVIMQNG
jgi:hypothetical protein